MRKLWWVLLMMLLVVLLAGVWVVFWYAPQKIEQRIQTAIAENQIDIQYDDFQISLLHGSVDLLGVNGNIPLVIQKHHLTAASTAGSIRIDGIQWWSLIRNQHFLAETVNLNDPDLYLTVDSLQQTPADTIQADSVSGKTAQFLADVELFRISNGRLRLHYPRDTAVDFTIDTINLEVHGINFNPKDELSPDNFDFFTFDLRCFNTLDGKLLHEISVGNIAGNSQDSTLTITQFNHIPRYSKRAFARHFPHKTDRLDISVPHIFIEGFHYADLLDNRIYLPSVDIPFFDLRDYIDKNVPHNENQYKTLPHQDLAKLGIILNIDTLRIGNAYINYAELLPERDHAGYVDFHQLEATITNITNDSLRWEKNNVIDAQIRCRLYNQAPLYVNFQFPMSESPWTYYYQGDLRNFPMAAANDMLQQSALLRFDAGYVNRLSFQVTANPELAIGEIDFFYKDIDIEFLDEHFQEDKKILNKLVEWLAFPQENKEGEKHRVGQMYFVRDTSRSIFSHLWKTVFSGMQSTIMPNIILPEELKHEKEKPEKETRKEKEQKSN